MDFNEEDFNQVISNIQFKLNNHSISPTDAYRKLSGLLISLEDNDLINGNKLDKLFAIECFNSIQAEVYSDEAPIFAEDGNYYFPTYQSNYDLLNVSKVNDICENIKF